MLCSPNYHVWKIDHFILKGRNCWKQTSEIECKKDKFLCFCTQGSSSDMGLKQLLKIQSHLSVAGSGVPLSQVKSFGCEWSVRDLHQNTTPGSNKCSQHPTNQREQLKHRGNHYRKTHISGNAGNGERRLFFLIQKSLARGTTNVILYLKVF